MKKRVISLFLSLILVFVTICATGCSTDETISTNKEVILKENQYQIYYISENKNSLKSKIVEYDDNVNITKRAEDFISMINESMKEELKDDSMNIKPISINVANGILNLDLYKGYYDLQNVIRILLRASMVMSLTQIEGVTHVSITVNGQALKDESGNTVGMLKADDFVSYKDGFPYTQKEVKLVLYFADENGQMLKKKELVEYYDYTVSYEKFIIEKLTEGLAGEKGYRDVLPKDLIVDMVYTKDGICYVDFDESIQKTVRTVPVELMIYSMVNSLSELSYITNVQFSIEGEGEIKLYNEYDLSESFSRNLDLVIKESEENK